MNTSSYANFSTHRKPATVYGIQMPKKLQVFVIAAWICEVQTVTLSTIKTQKFDLSGFHSGTVKGKVLEVKITQRNLLNYLNKIRRTGNTVHSEHSTTYL